MMTPNQLFPYQQRAANFQCHRDESALWVDMGLGKTVITLSSIAHLLRVGHLRAVLVVAPVRVCRLVWKQEAMKWTHTQHLTFSSMLGDKAERVTALLRTANIYLINYENLGWLSQVLQTYYLAKGKQIPFDGIVFDEISKCKNSTTNRVKALLPIIPNFKWSTGLTGTPSSNGYKDLHGQYLVLDGGKRLGVSKTHFEKSFYYKEGPYKQVAFKDTEQVIKGLIGDMTLEMSAEDYNPLPDIIVNNVMVDLTPSLRTLYETMERELFVTLDSGVDVDVFNQASLTNKCLQFANGSIYHVKGSSVFEELHDLKLDALEDIIEEAGGKPVLCSYSYRSDAMRIMERFKELKPINLTECHSEKALNDAMSRWTHGNCRLMIGHPASMGHGIDGLQKSGNILVWFGLNWSLDLYEQFNARIRRQGQGRPVVCHRILVSNTLDEAQSLALEEKAVTQESLRTAIKHYHATKVQP